MRHDPRTRTYVDERTKQGLSKKEIMRCLKRYVVREVHTAILADFTALNTGAVAKVGMEGTGSYGAGLPRFLTEYGLLVVEVDRPDRSTRRRLGKTDTIDAESAARAVLSGRASGAPKSRHAQVERIRALRVARRGAMKARIQAGGQLDALIVSAPEPGSACRPFWSA